MTGTELTALMAAILALFLALAWLLLRGFVGELRATRDVVSRGQEAWDAAAAAARALDTAWKLLDQRVHRLEGHDYHRLNEHVNGILGRLARVEADVQSIDHRLEELHETSIETNTIVKELRSR